MKSVNEVKAHPFDSRFANVAMLCEENDETSKQLLLHT